MREQRGNDVNDAAAPTATFLGFLPERY